MMMPALDSGTVAMLVGMLLTYCRVQACLLALPVFSERFLPVRVRVALAMSITPVLADYATLVQQPGAASHLALLGGIEVLSGLALGGLVRLFAVALDVAATAIAATASLSQLVGVATEYSPHPIGGILHLAGLALIMALGFPLLVCDMLRESFLLLPLGGVPDVTRILPLAISLVQRGFVLAMVLAAPFILGGFLYQLLSGMVSKVMPALPVVFIAAPGAIFLALLALVLLAPSIVLIWADAVLDVLQTDLP
ncbi:flagellar biosynthetic protein FliR [Paracoccus halophilus]|uniref:Flagellar biosynthetic protein FliR n=1 Tax=Paracoccus halophilus TaxID=376733 RepID=A0A099F827_9RHOB|nr:flagellar biosynthetic protein FliR [Paracoccus halophilus]KGJ06272.1 flagellar biosynthetic protein FliR [Paracoccus halophilus]SFA45252.1 flagellar biosynthetic protein FliR [Paracoccus halophilus]